MGQDNKFWEEWEKKYGKATPTPKPIEPVRYDPSQFSLGPAGPTPTGVPATAPTAAPTAPTAPTAAPISPGWEEWESKYGKTATAPVATTQTTAAPQGQGGFMDWARQELAPEVAKQLYVIPGAGIPIPDAWDAVKKGMTGLQDVANFFGQLHRTETLRQDVQNSYLRGTASGTQEAETEWRQEAIPQVVEEWDYAVNNWAAGGYGDITSVEAFRGLQAGLKEYRETAPWYEQMLNELAGPFTYSGYPIMDALFGRILGSAFKTLWKGRKLPFKAKQWLFKAGTEPNPDIVITPNELAAREVIERPGHVATGEIDTAAQKVADLNVRSKPGDVKFGFLDPETGEFRITLLPEEAADDAANAGFGVKIVRDDEIFVSEYRARIKQGAAEAGDVPVTPVVPEDAAPRVRVIPDDPEEVAFEIRVVEEAIQDLSARADISDINVDRMKFLGNVRARSNRWRQLFFEIDNNRENVLATTMAKFFSNEAPSKGVQDIVDWAQRRFPGSFKETKPRRVSTVKFDVLDELASEWNDGYNLGVMRTAEGKVDLEEVLSRIRLLWNRVDGVAEYERQLGLNQERLNALDNSPAGQALKERAEAAAKRASAEELEALVEHPEDMLRFLRDMVGQETRERPGFLSDEFLTRFNDTVDELTVLASEADLDDSIDVLLGVKDVDPARLLEGLDNIISGIGTTPGGRLEDLPPEAAPIEAAPAPEVGRTVQLGERVIGRSVTESTEQFPGGLLSKTESTTHSWRSMSEFEYNKIANGEKFGRQWQGFSFDAQGNRIPGEIDENAIAYWADSPGTAVPAPTERRGTMYLVEVEIPPRMWQDEPHPITGERVSRNLVPTIEREGTVADVRAVWKNMGEGWEPHALPAGARAPAEAAPGPGAVPGEGLPLDEGIEGGALPVEAARQEMIKEITVQLETDLRQLPGMTARLDEFGEIFDSRITAAGGMERVSAEEVQRIADDLIEQAKGPQEAVRGPAGSTRAAPASSYTPPATDLEELGMTAGEWAAQDTGADIWRMADGSAPQTGKPVTITTYSGSGRATREEVYARGVTGPILGDGFYGALSADAASKYGPDVSQYELTLHNPLVITSSIDLTKAIGRPMSAMGREWEASRGLIELQQAMIAGGHDGIIVNVPRSVDVNDAGESVKRIRELFGESQVFTLDPPRGGTQVRGPAGFSVLEPEGRTFTSTSRTFDPQGEAAAAPAPGTVPEPGITMAPRTAVQTGLEGFDVPGQQAEMIIGGTDVAKPQGLINPQEEAIRQENIQLVNDGQMLMDDALPEVMAANEGQHVDGPLRYDSTTARQYNGTDLNRGDLVTDGASLYRVDRVSGYMLTLDELHPSGDPLRIVRTVSRSVDPGDVDYYPDLYRHDPSKPVGGGGNTGWAADLGDGVGGEIPNKPRDMGPDDIDPQAPSVPPGVLGRLKGMFSSPGNDGGIYLADPHGIADHMDEVAEADELTQFLFKYIPVLRAMNPSVRKQDPVARLVTRLFQTQMEDDAFINVALSMAFDSHANVLTGRMSLPINWKTGQWEHGKWDVATQGPRPLWYDVFSMYKTKYAHLVSPAHARLITDYLFVIDDEVERIRELFGLPARRKRRPENTFFVPRKAVSWVDADERIVEFERPSDPNMPRLDLTATEIWQRFNVNFQTDPRAVMELHIRQALREIRMKEFNDVLEGMGAVVTYKDILAATNPQLIALRGAKFGEWEAAKKAVKAAVRALNGEELQTRIGKIMADVTQELKIDGIFSEAQIARRLEREGVRTSMAENIADLKAAERAARDEYFEAREMYRQAVEKIKKAEYINLQGDGVHLFGGMLKEGKHPISANQFKNKFSLSKDYKSVQEVISAMVGGDEQASIMYKMLFEQPANVVRTATSTFDAVLPFTHLLPLFGQNPAKWAQALAIHYVSFLAPGLQSKLVRWNLNDYWDLAVNGVAIGDPEVFAMMTPGKGINIDLVFKKWQQGHPAMGSTEEKAYEFFRQWQRLARGTMQQTVGRAQSAYQGALGYGRVLLKQAVEESWDGSSPEMYSYIRNMTGALDARRLGVTANQRAVESMWLAFSPRLLRSTVAVTHNALTAVYKIPAGTVGRNVPVGDVPVVGGAAARALGTGANAQQRNALIALSRLAAGITSIYIATGYAMGKDWEKDIKPGLNPLNGRQFLSYFTNGDWYGVGGQFRALMQLTWRLYGAISGKTGEWQDLKSINLDKNPFFYFYQTRGAMGMQWAGALIEGFSKPILGVQADVLPFDDIDGPSGLWDWGKTAYWPFSAQQYLESGTWGSVAWSATVGRVTPNPRDKAVAYITAGTPMEQNKWSDADPWLRAFANEHVMTGTSFEDVEMQRRYSLIQLPTSELEYDDWDDIDGDAGALRKWLSQDIEFEPPDVNDPDPNKSALAQYYKLFNSPNYVQKGTPRGDIVLPDTPQTGATWLSNQQAVLASEWTPEQYQHVLANTNLRPVPWFVVMQFPTSKKAQMIVASQSAREKILIDAGHPELALIHHNIFYMTPLGQSLGPEMDKYLADMPPKIGFEKAEEMTGYLAGTRDIVEQRNLAPDRAPVGAP